MEKKTPPREETSTLGSESDEEERIVGSETLSTYKWQPCTAYSGHINVKVRPKENTGRPASETVLRAMAEQEEKRKKEWMNQINELQ